LNIEEEKKPGEALNANIIFQSDPSKKGVTVSRHCSGGVRLRFVRSFCGSGKVFPVAVHLFVDPQNGEMEPVCSRDGILDV
jgi:hypothetical protein